MQPKRVSKRPCRVKARQKQIKIKGPEIGDRNPRRSQVGQPEEFKANEQVGNGRQRPMELENGEVGVQNPALIPDPMNSALPPPPPPPLPQNANRPVRLNPVIVNQLIGLNAPDLEIDINRAPAQPQLVNMAPTQFYGKIPNRETLRDFFCNAAKRYCPPQRELTMEFCQAILKGEKELLKISAVQWIDQVPNYKELSSKAIWLELGKDPVITRYFPVYSASRTPNKAYLLNVVNTLRPGSISEVVKSLQAKKQEKELEETPIVITGEFQALFTGFQTIAQDTRIYGLQGLQTTNYVNCPICFNPVRKKKLKTTFKCNRHVAHKKCARNYYRTDYNRNYLCPLRCAQALAQ